jgi:uncharacterized membrane protein
MKEKTKQTSPQISTHTLLLCAWTVAAILLYIARVIYTGRTRFFFLNWNLLLAWIPFIFSSLLFEFKKLREKRFFSMLILAIWLFFLPNAFYLITDFVHLSATPHVGLWYDVALIFAYVAAGFALGIHSIAQIDQLYLQDIKKWHRTTLIAGLFFLISFGIYLGRFLRWNSWDVFSNFFGVAEHIGVRIIDPFSYPRTYSFTLIYGGLMFLIYWSMDLIINKGKLKK